MRVLLAIATFLTLATHGTTELLAKEKEISCCASEKGPGYGAPWACPLYPIIPIGEGTLYFCDYFATTPCNNPTAYYLIGDYNWPYVSCSDSECQAIGAAGDEHASRTIPYAGLEEGVARGYEHKHGSSPAMAGQKPGGTKIPGGPVRRWLSATNIRHYLDGKVKDDEGNEIEVQALVLEFKFNRGLAAGRASEIVYRYVGFEFEDGLPEGASGVAIGNGKMLPGRAAAGTFKLSTGEEKTVLILLKK